MKSRYHPGSSETFVIRNTQQLDIEPTHSKEGSISRAKSDTLAIVIPLYNEADVFSELRRSLEELASRIGFDTNFYLIDDGSSDSTSPLLTSWANEDLRVKVVTLSRNFGHQIALSAGLDHVDPNTTYTVIMDGDLQDPPEVVEAMIVKAREGHEIVYARRREREGESAFKKATAHLFYRFISRIARVNIPENVGDFRLIGKQALTAFQQMPEKHRFVRGMFAWMGYSQAQVEFDRHSRAGGETKYSTTKMISLAWNATTSFSALPLRLALLPGIGATIFGIGYAIYSLVQHFRGETVPGWTTIVILLCLFNGSLLLAIWVIGEYVAKIFEESKSRPLYFVKETLNFEPSNRTAE